jgi:hypothetical protein
LAALREMMRERIAVAPAVERLGCAACPARCLFGHRLQPRNNRAVISALERLKGATVGQPPDWTLVRQLAQQQVGLILSEKRARQAAYCLIAQVSADPRLSALALRQVGGETQTV